MKVLLIIPSYNEEENVLQNYQRIVEYNKKHKTNYDAIVINDGSSDKTEEICIRESIPYISLVHNLGIGGAVQTGYKYALYHDYDIAIQFDGDGQHDVNYVEKICKPIINQEANMVIGSRYLDKEESEFQSTFMRRLGSNIISIFIKIFCGKKITDPTSGFRSADKKVIKEFANNYPTEYPEPESEVSLLVNGYTIIEKSVGMHEREGGVSSITKNFWKPVDYMMKVVLAIIIDSISFRKKGGKK